MTRMIIEALRQRFPSIQADVRYLPCHTKPPECRARHCFAGGTAAGSRCTEYRSNRLRVGRRMGIPAYLINDATELDPAWFDGVNKVGLSLRLRAGAFGAGGIASVCLRPVTVTPMTVIEHTRFKLPKEVLELFILLPRNQ